MVTDKTIEPVKSRSRNRQCYFKFGLRHMALLAILTGLPLLAGCATHSAARPDVFAVMRKVDEAAIMYHNVYGEWPKSLDQLQTPRPGGDQEFKKDLSDALSQITPEEAQYKISFATMQNGNISIEIVGLTTDDKVTAVLQVPKKFSHAE